MYSTAPADWAIKFKDYYLVETQKFLPVPEVPPESRIPNTR